MALASLPTSESLMLDSPRSREDFIISPAMWRLIISTGVIFFIVLLGLLYVFRHADITSLTQLAHPHLGAEADLTPYELSLFFTIFVFMQLWNLFNARAFATHRSAFHLGSCGEFLFIVALIVVGQVAIVSLGGAAFSVTRLRLSDWFIIIAGTSPVLLLGELLRRLHR
ncbi:MAG: cation transporting ATPase C-terminal domain-containing protein, partial [Muribaculaceae bacterium]|nr:cation transporting ATPase C-terminal domain-containing protein [Muribaculaceae bacterium]